jgi:hypothetical protein
MTSYGPVMNSMRYKHRHLDVACDLEAADGVTRVEEWQRLRRDAGLGSAAIPGGVRLWLRADARPAAEDLIQREAACCGFLDLALATEADRLRLDITSPANGAASVIALLARVGEEEDRQGAFEQGPATDRE